MGCLFLLVSLLSPRLGIIILWALTDYVYRAFQGMWLWPLLGLIFSPGRPSFSYWSPLQSETSPSGAG